MLQKGIALTSLEVSYVSALSWYFVTVMGLRGLFSLALGANNAADNAAAMKAQMNMGQPQPGAPVDFTALFSTERNELVRYKSSFVFV